MVALSTNTSMSQITSTAEDANSVAPTYMAVLFLLSLVVPVFIHAGPVLLMPHRIVLMVFFIPCAIRLLSGKAGRLIAADWLIFGSAIWGCLAFAKNHGAGAIQPSGIHMIEFFGAYMLARVSIRSAEDFRRMVKTMFWIVLLLLPFAALESLSRRNILLEKIPSAIPIINIPARWGMRRAQTLFAHPIHYGIFCSIGMGLFWYVTKSAGRRVLSVPIVVASTIFSLSSAALICVVCQSVFIAWESLMKSIKARWRILAGIFVTLYVFVELASDRGFFILLTQYASFNTGSSYNRVLIWRWGMINVQDNPIFGLGFREWVRAPWMSSSADNFWLLIAMQLGVPAFLMFAGGVLYILWKTARTHLNSTLGRACQAGFLTACGGIIIGGGTVHYWTAMMALVLFFFGSGTWIFTTENRDETLAEEEVAPQGTISRYSRRPIISRAEKNAPEVKPAPVVVEKEGKTYRRKQTLHQRQIAMREARAQKTPK